ncbi:MAG: flavodoxin domain-containing protein [Caulobacteraceae bacterium]
MNTLVIYATKHGSTRKCASMLSKKLEGKVDLHDIKAGKAPDLEQYDKVVIGGSIYAGRIQKEITEFCSQNLDALKNKKLGLFICCMLKDNAVLQLKSSYPEELMSRAIASGSFGGEMNFSDMSFGERLITKLVSKTMAKNDPNSAGMNMKKGISVLSGETIDKFAKTMNNAYEGIL